MCASGEVLINKAVAGDEDALAGLLEAQHAKLHARVSALIDPKLRAAFGADDVLQVTYLEVFMRIRQFCPNGPGAFDHWIAIIAEHNLQDCIRELKRQKRPPRHLQIAPPTFRVEGDSYVDLLASLPGSQSTPSQHASRGEIRDIIEQALKKLPSDYAHVVRAYDLEDREVAEIAAEMGRSPGAIYMLRARGLDWLAEFLGESTLFFSGSA